MHASPSFCIAVSATDEGTGGAVGDLEGVAVGIIVGSNVGAAVGDLEGVAVGIIIGD